MEDPTQPMFPVSEPESISAPQEPVIVTDPTPHTKKKKHNGDCILSDCIATALSDTFPSSGRAVACTAVGAAGILGALNVLSANWQCDGANYRSISGDFSVVVCLFGFCLAAACFWSMPAA